MYAAELPEPTKSDGSIFDRDHSAVAVPLNMSFCALCGFALHMNDCAGGDTYSEIETAAIREKPVYTKHTTTQPSIIGATYVFKVEAYNQNGQTFREIARI